MLQTLKCRAENTPVDYTKVYEETKETITRINNLQILRHGGSGFPMPQVPKKRGLAGLIMKAVEKLKF